MIAVSSEITQQDVDELLREVDRLTEGIGNEVADTISGNLESGENVNGRLVQHGSLTYSVQASPAWPFVLLESGYNIAEDLAMGQKQAQTDGGVQQVQPPNDQDVSRAKETLRDNADTDLKDIRLEVVDAISDGPLSVQLDADEEFVYGFTARRRLYAHDRDISIQEYFDEVQTLISAVYHGKEILQRRYDIESAVGDPSAGPRGYQ